MKNCICIISGPTASGKTAKSIALAKKFSGEIINFDSLLLYKELNIGTAKPSIEEQMNVPHHLIGSHSIKEPINAAQYIKEAIPLIQNLHAQKKIVYLVGGSGFYLQALLFGMYDSQTSNPLVLQRSQDLYDKEGIEPFIQILKINDNESYNLYHPNDHYRIRRAVEHFWTTNQPMFKARINMDDKKKNAPYVKLNWHIFHAYLDLPKEVHFKIIQERTQNMIHKGLILEVQNLLKQGYTGTEKPMQSIGYKEVVDFLEGKYSTQKEMMDRINISTRQLAKSQRTWFKKWDKSQYNPITDSKKLILDFENYLNQ